MSKTKEEANHTIWSGSFFSIISTELELEDFRGKIEAVIKAESH